MNMRFGVALRLLYFLRRRCINLTLQMSDIVKRKNRPMKKRYKQKTARVFVPILVIVSFVLCGIAGAYCPMSSSEAAGHSSQPASPHSPSDHSKVCPEQLSTANEQLKELSPVALPVTHFHILDLFTNASTQKFTFARTTPSSSYPLLFLRFSVLLN
jgi:hypothetical protein